MLLVLASLLRLVALLFRDDLPTFERPAKQNSGRDGSGQASRDGALLINSAFSKGIRRSRSPLFQQGKATKRSGSENSQDAFTLDSLSEYLLWPSTLRKRLCTIDRTGIDVGNQRLDIANEVEKARNITSCGL